MSAEAIETRPSGHVWLGPIPANWEVTPLKFVAEVFPSNVDKHSRDGEVPVSLCNYTDVYYNDVIAGGLDFMKATATVEQVDRFRLRAGDTIITKDSESAGDIGLSAFVPDDLEGVVCGYHLSMIRPGGRLLGRYVKRLFDSHYVKAVLETSANGLTRVGLGQYALDNIDIPLPPVQVQEAITDFLDRETAKIDALIAKQEQLISTLREDRATTITQAITKGLDPNVEMVGVGELTSPAHWKKAVPLKRVASVQTGLTLGRAVSAESAVTLPYLRVANVQAGRVDLAQVTEVEIDRAEVGRYLLRAGDVLMTEGGDIDKLGRGCLWQAEVDPCLHQNHVFAVRCSNQLDARFLVYLLDTSPARNYFMLTAKKTTNLASTNSTTLGRFSFALPSISEQEAIVEYLDDRCAKIDALTSKSAEMIDTLREYRSALITDAVTGKIDVREVA